MASVFLAFLGTVPKAALAGVPFLISILWFAIGTVYNLFFSGLKSVPGPFLARITRLWELEQVRRGLSHRVFQELHNKYGPTVRVGPNRYSVSRPADIKQIYALGGKFAKTAFYNPASSLEWDNIFSVRDMADHAD